MPGRTSIGGRIQQRHNIPFPEVSSGTFCRIAVFQSLVQLSKSLIINDLDFLCGLARNL
jgi:hypothetical protein